jgi:hypothetical protein
MIYIYDIIIWDTVYPGFTNLGEQRANKSPLPSGLSPEGDGGILSQSLLASNVPWEPRGFWM